VGCQFLNYLVNVFARMHVPHRQLVIGRACHSLFAILLPVLGALLAGLSGAMWCFVATIASSAAIWVLLVLLNSRRQAGVAIQPDPHAWAAP
jgi:hypothetical protein